MSGDMGSSAGARSEPNGGDERLWGLLQELLQSRGRLRAAELLGVSERTLRRAQEAGRLTRPLASVLARHAATLPGADSNLRDVTVALAGLAQRVEALEQHTSEAQAALQTELAELIEANRELQGWVTALERRQVGELVPVADETTETSSSSAGVSRRYPQLVTLEAEAGEERVYGAATPLVIEWRAARQALAGTGDSYVRLEADLLLTELERELIESHQLTLPPADIPWDGLRRHSELRRRERSLARLRRERRRARLARWALRLLTLGWRGR